MIGPVAALLAAASLAGSGQIVLWHQYTGAEQQAIEELVDQFAKLHPEYQVKTLGLPAEAFAAKLTSSLPTGNGPDVFVYPGQDRIGGWAREHLIAPIDSDLDALASQFPASAVQAVKFEGHAYGLPLAVKNTALYYNRALIPHPPKTTDELLALAQAHTDRAAGQYGLGYVTNDFYVHAAWLHGFGGTVFQEPGHRPVLNTPEAVRALEFVRELALEKKVMPDEPTGVLISTLFNSGKLAMVISGPWFASELKGVDYGIATLPIVSATGRPMMPFLTVEAALFPSKAHNPEGARELARFLVGRDAAILRATVGRQVVATRAAYDDPRVSADSFISAFRAQAENTVPIDNTPAMVTVWEPEKRALTAVINGELTPEEALAQAQRRVLAF